MIRSSAFLLQKYPAARRWFIASAVVSLLFFIYTAMYATGILNQSTVEIERWLVGRPITRLDCSFLMWRQLGEAPMTAVVLLLLGVVCVLAGHRKRVLVYLLGLLFLAVVIEVVGKMLFTLPLPPNLRSGMTVLTCPQMQGQPFSVHLAAGLGLLGQVPNPPGQQVNWAHTVSQLPLLPSTGDSENSFPGGHAMRWCLTGLVLAWICARYLRPRWSGRILMVICGLGAFLGGFMQMYIGVHFITDTIAGYLIGVALGCCAIGILIMNDTKTQPVRPVIPVQDGNPAIDVASEHSFSGQRR
ncbi:phosphatase PAP2 family protein [Dictyobacter arantiisoli]|uniref:Phosphatidic acid phosphatase type 2/haloperoxidase domain-containing protein n=1 Tax=Dictyobacter arantiisoli TaxID=2014874 RepID=A0A5A5TGM7_9CHLR|nr:phosphatase PAP2 family protein [Dictyobacter arantiisoli]GCF10104.1 hypothetical protein KDI_36680 [Dictyobacter arantiisoli]